MRLSILRDSVVTYRLSRKFSSAVEPTERVVEVASMFGLGLDDSRDVTVLEDLEVRIEPGQVVYITGQSGSGKSVLLKELKEQGIHVGVAPLWSIGAEDVQETAKERVGRKLTDDELRLVEKGLSSGLGFDLDTVVNTSIDEAVEV